jgi:molybdopterin synthase catalytic subunit
MATDPSLIQTIVRDIAEAALDPAEALAFVSDDAFGGIDMFIGRVRRQSHGRAVTGIHYDMFDPLALTVFARAAQSAMASFGPALKVYVAHAKGRLAVGDLAVVIAVGSPHRDEAFRACREVIETVKHQAPIWKQEHFVDGASEWSEGCTLCGQEHVAIAPAAGMSPVRGL